MKIILGHRFFARSVINVFNFFHYAFKCQHVTCKIQVLTADVILACMETTSPLLCITELLTEGSVVGCHTSGEGEASCIALLQCYWTVLVGKEETLQFSHLIA